MTTVLKKYTQAYATMTVATYEPLILRWISGWTIYTAANSMAWRMQKAKLIDLGSSFSTAGALHTGLAHFSLPRQIDVPTAPPPPDPKVLSRAGAPVSSQNVTPVKVEGFPNAVAVGDKVYLNGIVDVRLDGMIRTSLGQELQRGAQGPDVISLHQSLAVLGYEVDAAEAHFSERTEFAVRRFQREHGVHENGVFNAETARAVAAATASIRAGDPYMPALALPTVINRALGYLDPDFKFQDARKQVFQTMIGAVEKALHQPDVDEAMAGALRSALQNVNGLALYEFLPVVRVTEALSPIGIAHFYRQLYFNTEEGIGPIEEAFTVAPLETLEVVYETTRRQIHEEIVEVGSEVVSEFAEESKNLDEVSDKVGSMIQRDMSASMSASASGSIGVWSGEASATASMDISTQNSRESTSHRLKEVTKRAAERITKTYSLKTRDIEDVTTTNLTRRVIKNELDHPVSYGLRRVFRTVLVKTQDLGPRLVWQLYIHNPGDGLARSRYVRFRESEHISVPEVPPGLPPRPKGGTDTGTTSCTVAWDNSQHTYFVTLVIHTDADRQITAVSIDSINDLEGGGKDDQSPSPLNKLEWGQKWDSTARTFTVNIGVNPGDSSSVSVAYTYTWEPSGAVMDEWEQQRQAAVQALTEQLLNEQFEREKTLITERSKIHPRPANDLRREERYEVMNRMISQLFARGDDPSDPSPLEIEYFHRYFDIEGIFIYTHPSWWKPRYSAVSTGLQRPAYEITADSEPSPMGSSLGWMIQLDGDTRRNEFLNSPWVRTCLPIRPGREREAIAWLAKHIEGQYGYDPNKNPLKQLLTDIEKFRADEAALGVNGPDYVTVSSTVGAPGGPLKPENVYPIIQEFEVTLPTDGFVYDELLIQV